MRYVAGMIDRHDDTRPRDDAASLRRDLVGKLYFELAKFPEVATRNDQFLALAFAVRDRVLHRWVESSRTYLEGKSRSVVYLSAEFLIGPQLAANLLALGLHTAARTALADLGISLDELVEHEEEPGLGNGGLGRLAACFMESMATLDIPAIGHSLRYEFGTFDQEIRDGWQIEHTDRWLRNGNPWEVRRFEIEHPVGFGGFVEHTTDLHGRLRVYWHPERRVKGIPYDVPVPGYGTNTTCFLRLWSAAADEEFNLDAFQVGEYWRAVDQKIQSENLTKVIYPNDTSPAGKQLRLEQEYFFVSCALQDCIRLLLQRGTIREFADKFAIQLNDTHPSLAVPELMRLLMDVHDLAADLEPRNVGGAGGRRILAHPLHDVGPVDPRGDDLDEDFARARHGHGTRDRPQHVRAPRSRDLDRAHGRGNGWHWASILFRGASPLGLPDTLSRAPLRRRAPCAWLARCAHSRDGDRRSMSQLHFAWVANACATMRR